MIIHDGPHPQQPKPKSHPITPITAIRDSDNTPMPRQQPHQPTPKSHESRPQSQKSQFTQFFKLRQKIILPRYCRTDGRFVLNSPSIQHTNSYEYHHPTPHSRQYLPHLPSHNPNGTTKHPHSELAGPAASCREIAGTCRISGKFSDPIHTTEGRARYAAYRSPYMNSSMFTCSPPRSFDVFAASTAASEFSDDP